MTTIKAVLYGASLGAVLVLWAVCGRGRGVTPLPPVFSSAMAAHAAERSADSAQALRWRAAADSARQHEAAALAKAARDESQARVDSARSLTLLTERQLPLALGARAEEALTLRAAVVAEDSAVVAADTRAAVLDSGYTVTAREARTADSLLGQAVEVAGSRDPPCRVFSIFPCPARKAVALGAVVLGFAAAKGWLLGVAKVL